MKCKSKQALNSAIVDIYILYINFLVCSKIILVDCIFNIIKFILIRVQLEPMRVTTSRYKKFESEERERKRESTSTSEVVRYLVGTSKRTAPMKA